MDFYELLFLLSINDIHRCSNKLPFFLFADDTNILYADRDLKSLEQTKNLHDWLTTNKLNLNTKKSNLVIFRPKQKKIRYLPQISTFDSGKKKEESAWNIRVISSI